MKYYIKGIGGLVLIVVWIVISSFVYAMAENVSITPTLPLTSNTQLKDLTIDVSIAYDDFYHENVLLTKKPLILEFVAQNTGVSNKRIQFLVGLYTEDNKMVDIAYSEMNINAGATEYVEISKDIPDGIIEQAIVYIWDNFNDTEPHIIFAMGPTLLDYYANDITDATLVKDFSKRISGSINTISDTDFIKFTASKNEDYLFSFLDGSGVKASLYDSKQNLLVDKATRFYETLVKEQTYYIKIESSKVEDYIFSIQRDGLDISLSKGEVYVLPIVRKISGTRFYISFDSNYLVLDDSYLDKNGVRLEQDSNGEIELFYSGTSDFVTVLPVRAKETGNSRIIVREAN